MLFEDVLPALRTGKEVRRAGWQSGEHLVRAPDGILCNQTSNQMYIIANEFVTALDWEIIAEPKRVADYFIIAGDFYVSPWKVEPAYVKQTHEVGTQPDGAVLIPNSEREEIA